MHLLWRTNQSAHRGAVPVEGVAAYLGKASPFRGGDRFECDAHVRGTGTIRSGAPRTDGLSVALSRV